MTLFKNPFKPADVAETAPSDTKRDRASAELKAYFQQLQAKQSVEDIRKYAAYSTGRDLVLSMIDMYTAIRLHQGKTNTSGKDVKEYHDAYTSIVIMESVDKCISRTAMLIESEAFFGYHVSGQECVDAFFDREMAGFKETFQGKFSELGVSVDDFRKFAADNADLMIDTARKNYEHIYADDEHRADRYADNIFEAVKEMHRRYGISYVFLSKNLK